MSTNDTTGADPNDITDPSYIQLLTASIETIINTALQYDPASRKKIAALHDILAIETTIPALCFYIRGQEEGVRVFSYCEAPVCTHLKGSPLALLMLLQQPNNLSNSGVSLTGNTHLLQQWQRILHTLEIDWEEAISQVLGDIAGSLSATGIRRSTSYAKEQIKEHGRLITEYLSEELKVTPSKAEANALFDQIDQLNLRLDRISAHIQIWQSQQNSKETT
jgi:ubiquinone biosynthesis protein UbiJ